MLGCHKQNEKKPPTKGGVKTVLRDDKIRPGPSPHRRLTNVSMEGGSQPHHLRLGTTPGPLLTS